MGRFWADLRYTIRSLRRAPALSLAVLATLALGIGGSTAIFGFIRGILLRPLPYPNESRLVMVCETHPERPPEWCGASPGNSAEWARAARTMDAMGLARDWPFALQRDGAQEAVSGGVVTAGLFEVFDVRPARGRLFVPGDSDPGAEPVAIVSHAFWRSSLGGDASAIGRRMRLDGEDRILAGVLPPDFEVPFLDGVQVWIPIWPDRRDSHDWRGFRSFARLAPGATLEQARAEMDSIRAAFETQHPEANRGWSVVVDGLRERTVRTVRPSLLAFLASVGLVLLIACANIANLLLARASRREREFALRSALGAAPARLAGQLLTESLVLALAGGALGLLVAAWATDLLVGLAPGDIPRLGDVRVDGWVLAFALLVSMGTSLLFGLAPAWHACRPAAHETLREGRQPSEGRRGVRTRNVLVAVEVGLALLLLAAAGLLLRSYANLLDWRPGFDRSNLLVMQAFSSPGKYPRSVQVAEVYDRAVAALGSIPGVVAAGAGSAVPLLGGDGSEEFYVEGRPVPPAGARPAVLWFDVGPTYFQTLGIPLTRGRLFTPDDGPSTERVAIINETMARRIWPGEDPIGRRVTLTLHGMTVTIVGVVGDVRPFRPDQSPEPAIYWPFRQLPRWGIQFVLRTATDPGAAIAAARARLAEVDPDISVGVITTMDQLVARRLVRPRFQMLLIGLLALLALAITTVGVYGVIAYAVETRRHEIGVRIAVGARRGDVVRMVIVSGMSWALAGIAFGLAAALATLPLLRALLVGVGAADPATLAGAALLLALTALAGCALPALRATRVDPLLALRSE